MVAKNPSIHGRMPSPVNPILVRETVQKVDKCMARLLELQFTLNGGAKVISGVKLSPRSTKGYLRTSLRCKQESLRLKNEGAQIFPTTTIQANVDAEEWQRMSLSANLLGQTMAEILQASKFVHRPRTRINKEPNTPEACHRSRGPLPFENTEMKVRRTKEKQRSLASEFGSPILRKARSRISFKATSPPNRREQRNSRDVKASVTVSHVSPRARPWAKKTVLFPNPLFLSTSPSSSHQMKFYKTGSPIIARTSQRTPHKFIIKSPPTNMGSQFKSKKAVPAVAVSPIKSKGSASNPRRYSFSPSKMANKLVSPLKARLSLPKGVRGLNRVMNRRSISGDVKMSFRPK
ncbi:hypothetical protein HPP92_002896 [Vanilla planifolia]|uniref:Microtubule-binding protein TANGLED n=1 Tax=Vanilla planifolia TaxID=51239 RepID=A0A835S1Y9_VANPL|nr:hypothetical protein HPP92_003277 [Vanilla planifolia]KAG0502824.1 hypothetical protein HPP92_002896 [Vanilla planifolia]